MAGLADCIKKHNASSQMFPKHVWVRAKNRATLAHRKPQQVRDSSILVNAATMSVRGSYGTGKTGCTSQRIRLMVTVGAPRESDVTETFATRRPKDYSHEGRSFPVIDGSSWRSFGRIRVLRGHSVPSYSPSGS